ncbi:hypothetical protein [Pyrococcus kukulkanii]|uniref:DUF2179 domain-containing protein n=1 Tax=Pyrococcus kukulkanii TaxID=1609559 RepID=A0ABV4T8M0_9EURY
MKALKALVLIPSLYYIYHLLSNVSLLMETLSLGLSILGIPLDAMTFLGLILSLIGTAAILSPKPSYSIASIAFMMYFLIWVGQNSQVLSSISPAFTNIFLAFFPDVSSEDIAIITLILVISYFFDLYWKYEEIRTPIRERLIGVATFTVITLVAFLISLLIKPPRLPSINPIILLPLFGLGLYLLSQEREKHVITVVRIRTNAIAEVKVEDKKLIIIPKRGPIGTKVIEFEGQFDKVVMLEEDREVQLKKILESVDDNGVRLILYSNEETKPI